MKDVHGPGEILRSSAGRSADASRPAARILRLLLLVAGCGAGAFAQASPTSSYVTVTVVVRAGLQNGSDATTLNVCPSIAKSSFVSWDLM